LRAHTPELDPLRCGSNSSKSDSDNCSVRSSNHRGRCGPDQNPKWLEVNWIIRCGVPIRAAGITSSSSDVIRDPIEAQYIGTSSSINCLASDSDVCEDPQGGH